MARTILVVDDEPTLRETLVDALEADGFRVVSAADGREALTRFRAERPDLVLLDLMLPELSGIEVCRIIRAESGVPIVMLTAKDSELDKVVGLELGADDYVTKPFSLRELAARVRAILRRMERMRQVADGEPLERFDLLIDTARRRVTKSEAEVILTPLEFEILATLARQPGVVLGRDDLMDRVWGYRDYAGGRVVDSHVARIRRKLGDDAAEPIYIRTVHGVGYAFRESPS
jgi:DNA-binding response OmpR family regulator